MRWILVTLSSHRDVRRYAAALSLPIAFAAGPPLGAVATLPADVFADGFESNGVCRWQAAVGFDTPCDRLLARVVEIQSGGASGAIALVSVAVTAISVDLKNLWVADAASAGPWQGIFVFRGAAASILTVAIGDLVDLTGTTAEFDNSPPGDTLTQIVADAESIDFVSTGGTPAPLAVAADALGSIVDGEPYEGVLVQLNEIAQVSSVETSDRLTVLGLTSGGTLRVDDQIFDYASASYPVVSTCFSGLAGVVTVNLFDDARVLLPRSADDLVTAACPP